MKQLTQQHLERIIVSLEGMQELVGDIYTAIKSENYDIAIRDLMILDKYELNMLKTYVKTFMVSEDEETIKERRIESLREEIFEENVVQLVTYEGVSEVMNTYTKNGKVYTSFPERVWEVVFYDTNGKPQWSSRKATLADRQRRNQVVDLLRGECSEACKGAKA